VPSLRDPDSQELDMKAMVNDVYGSPSVVMGLREIDKPAIGDEQVLVRVRAASVNPPDWAAVTGIPYIARTAFGLLKPNVRVRGTDVAGVVEEVGAAVRRLHVGDEVFGRGTAAFAEYAAAAEADLVAKPANVTFEQAGAVAMSGLTALQGLRDVGRVQSGQKVLIVGAGGGIGTFAVQIAKALGADVTGVCGPSKVETVRLLGADHIIDYTKDDFTRGDERYDMILDNVLTHSLSQLVRVLEPTGTLVPNSGQFLRKPWIASMGVNLVKAPLLSLFARRRIQSFLMRSNQEDLLFLRDLIASGRLTPVVGSTFPLEQAADAIACWGDGHSTGKIVIED
jgi:NADPH:quinone reductase-like Zn-dependent oxidoreductase